MNGALKALINDMLTKKHIIGKKHVPEKKIVKLKTKWLQKDDARAFEKEYREAIKRGLILRIKKKTGKGSGWHISLNPRKLKELHKMIG